MQKTMPLILLGLAVGSCGLTDPPGIQAALARPTGRSRTQVELKETPAAEQREPAKAAEYPLQSWMRSTLQAYVRAEDYARLEGALQLLADRAPNDYAGWRESASRGAEGARDQDLGAVREACKTCHEQHRARFKSEMRDTRLF